MNLRTKAKLAAIATAFGTVSAFAADPFTDAITAATTSTQTYAAALVVLSAVSVIFMIGMKYVKRIPRAA